MTFDELTRNLADKVEKGGEKAKEFIENGADKASLLAELTKYNFAVSREKTTAEKLYAEIGKAYCRRESSERLDDLKMKVESCNRNIASMERKCDEIRAKVNGKASGAGEVLCVSCGAVNKASDVYCAVCKAKLI